MSPTRLRDALREFLGDASFRKFVADLFHLKRLRYWQDQRLQEFATLYPDLALDSNSLAAALRICEVHGRELYLGTPAIFRGTKERTKLYIDARNRQFPHAGLSPFQSHDEDAATREIWLCSDCVAEEAAWKADQSPGVTRADIRMRQTKYPFVGIPIEDLQQALQLIAGSDQVVDKRVMGFRLYDDGHLLIKTGEQRAELSGGGDEVLLRKEGSQWVLLETSRWFS